MFYCNDKVKRIASVKPTNKLNINKYILTSLSKVKIVKNDNSSDTELVSVA